MRKWEKKYEEFKSAETKMKFDKLNEKVNSNQATKDELKEYKKMERIYGYLPQVENLKDAISLLNDRMEILEEEKNTRINMAKIEKIEAEIEADRKKYLEAQENGKEDFDKLVKIQDKEIKLNDMKKKVAKRDPEFADMSNDDLKNEILVTKGQISKCHLAARCFMEGYSRDSIDLKVNKEWKNRRFTSKEPISKINKDSKDKSSGETKKDVPNVSKEQENKQPIGVISKKMDSALDNLYQQQDKNDGNIQPLDINKIKEQIKEEHPWLTRFMKIPILGRLAKRNLHKYEQNLIYEEEKKAKEKIEEAEKEKTASQEFKAKYSLANYDVMDIAEKGVKGLDDERVENAKLRYEEMKKRAQDPNRYQIDENGVKHDNMEKTTKEDEEER